MKHWMVWLLAGVAAVIGGLAALFNLSSASDLTLKLGGWTLVAVGFLQGWAAYKAPSFKNGAGAGLLAAVGFFLGGSLLFGPFGDGSLLRIILGTLLIASGAGKLWLGRSLRGDTTYSALLASGGVSALLGLIVLMGISFNFGLIVALELLASGIGLVLLSLRLKNHAREN